MSLCTSIASAEDEAHARRLIWKARDIGRFTTSAVLGHTEGNLWYSRSSCNLTNIGLLTIGRHYTLTVKQKTVGRYDCINLLFLICIKATKKIFLRFLIRFRTRVILMKSCVARWNPRLARMKSSAFGFRWNQIRPSSAVRQISSRSDFIRRRWIYSAKGGFNWKNDKSKLVVFSGCGTRIRT